MEILDFVEYLRAKIEKEEKRMDGPFPYVSNEGNGRGRVNQ